MSFQLSVRSDKRFFHIRVSIWHKLLFLICLSFSIIVLHQSNQTFVSNVLDGRTQIIQSGVTPDGLTAAEWESIKAQISSRPYQVSAASTTGYASTNPANGWQTAYSPGGTTQLSPQGEAAPSWQWGLKLTSYGYENGLMVSQPESLMADGQTLTYQWDRNLSEWWINNDQGLEQGFTLQERPQMFLSNLGSPLVLEMAVSGNLMPVLNGDMVSFQRSSGETVLTYDKLEVFDANGRSVSAHFSLVPGADATATLRIIVDEATAVYPLTIDPTVEQAYMKPSNPGINDRFGQAVAVSGDTVVVAAHLEDSNAIGVGGDDTNNDALDSGAAYVFVRSGGVWAQQAYLKASNTDSGDLFGTSVAISGNIIVVGAPNEDSNATGVGGDEDDDSEPTSGAAYVFVRSGSTWSQQAYLKSFNSEGGDRFGSSVGVSGETVVVGAKTEDSDATGVGGSDNDDASDSGAAYVFIRSGGMWSQQAYLKASNTDPADNFGVSLGISGDTIIVGAELEDSDTTGVGVLENNDALNAGAAYIFTRSGVIWSQQAYLKASNTDAGDVFGIYVAISGDTAVVGAVAEGSNGTGVNSPAQADNSMLGAGAAYVFLRSAGMWSQEAYLKASNTEGFDNFGYSVAISGDTIIVGAWQEDGSSGINGTNNNSLQDAGAAYLYKRTNGIWASPVYLKASNRELGDLFGNTVSVSGDVAVVSAFFEDGSSSGINGSDNNGAFNAGAAYLFRDSFCSNQSGNWNSTATWVGGVVPGSSDSACIAIGDTVTLNVAGAVDSLTVYPDAALDLDTFGFTAENGVTNHGTLSQTMTVNGGTADFLHIQNAGATATQYRGVTLDAMGNNLGTVRVGVRETINWETFLNSDGYNFTQYCTDSEGMSAAYAQRCFRINPTTQPVSDVTVRLWGLTSELNGIAENDLAVFRHIGGTSWLEVTTSAGTGNDTGNYSYAEGDTSGFSAFLLGETGNTPTAVTLVSSTVVSQSSIIIFMMLVLLLGVTSIVWLTRKKLTD